MKVIINKKYKFVKSVHKILENSTLKYKIISVNLKLNLSSNKNNKNGKPL